MSAKLSSAAATMAVTLAFVFVLPAAAQQREEGPNTTYEREVFYYDSVGRVDPFRSLLEDGDLGIRIEDLALRGVIHHRDPARSVAILAREGSERRIQARIGEQFGALRIVAIYPDRVDVIIEELGVARRESLQIERKQPEEGAR